MQQGISYINKSTRQRLNAIWSSFFPLRWVNLIGLSHFQHHFDLLFFGNHIRKNAFTNMSQLISCNLPNKNRPSFYLGSLSSCIRCLQPSKSIMKVVNQVFICIGNLYGSCKISGTSFLVKGMGANINTTFPFYDSCQISVLKFTRLFHIFPFVMNGLSIIQDSGINLQPERLKRVDAFTGEAIV